MEGVQISSASLRDLRPVLRLERVCFGVDAWPVIDVMSVLLWPGEVRLRATLDRMVIGIVIAERTWKDGMSMITTIAVDPEFRRRGVGSALLEACESELPGEKIRLTVREDNLPAIRMYERFGYTYLSRVPNYYRDGRSGLVMEKTRGASGGLRLPPAESSPNPEGMPERVAFFE
jgi:ribosomal protein S18 acetylase RimI-like enzyme